MTRDEHAIHQVIERWMHATTARDPDKLRELMAEDVVFLTPGEPPLRGVEAFLELFRQGMHQVQIEGHFDIQEMHVCGDFAWVWNLVGITVTPLHGGPSMQRGGHILSIFRRTPDGRWVLSRDANLFAGEVERVALGES